MTLPGPEATQRWQGRTLVDRNGEAVGSIAIIYRDKATDQPEWALLEASTRRPGPTFVPLVNASEEGDTVRVASDKTLIERAPSVSADRELSEEQEAELYRHYGIPYSRAESPSGLPANAPPRAGESQPAGPPPPAGEQVRAAESLPAGGAAPSGPPRETTVSEPAPRPTGDVPPVTGRVGAPPSQSPIVGDAVVDGRRLGITDPRVAVAAGAGLAVAAAVWRRAAIARQISSAIRQLGTIPRTVSRRRRQRRRAKAVTQAMSGASRQATALGREMARVLFGTALLSLAAAVRGGQRTWAGVQAAQASVRQNARRLQPRPRRRRRRRMFGMVGAATASSRLGAIPGTVDRRRRRRRAKAVNQALASATARTWALARGMARVLVGTALLPAATAVRGGQRTWAGVQAVQASVRQRGRRLRPAPRKRRRRGGFGMVLGGAAGYVLGARAGEQGYQQVAQTARRLTERPELRRVGDRAVAKLDQLSGQAAEKLQKQRLSISGEAGSGGATQPITAVPETPPEPRP